MLTDTHCHLASKEFAGQIPQVLAHAQEAGVQRMVSLATNLEDMPLNATLAEAHSNIYFGAGIHPCDVHQTPDSYLKELGHWIQHPKAVAIGETGLDYFHPAPQGWSEKDYHKRQRESLEQHFALAQTEGIPIVIHTRDREGRQSFQDCLKIYQSYSKQVRAVFHCFIGTCEEAEQVLALGGVLSFTGITTFPKGKEVLEVAKTIPKDRLMVETDAPYLAPVPYRGKRCQPAYVRETALCIAQARGEEPEAFFQQTEEVAQSFFKWSK